MTLRPSSLIVAAFLLLWTGIVLFVLATLTRSIVQQVQTYAYTETTGVITHSAVVPVGTGRKKSSQFKIEYDYAIEGRTYQGSRYVYGQFGSNAKMWTEVQSQFPVGASVPVYYRESDPSDAVLHRGLMGFHLAVPMFMMPFTIVAVGGWYVLLTYRRPKFGPHRVEPTVQGYSVRLPEISRLSIFTLSLLLLSFGGTFAIVFGLGTNPPLAVMIASFAALFLLSLLAAYRFARYPILDVNTDDRTFTLPDGKAYHFDAIKRFAVHQEYRRTSKTTQTIHHVAGLLQDSHRIPIAHYSDAGDAGRLADWLNQRLDGKPLD